MLVESRAEKSYVLDAPIERVYALLADVARSGPMFPGVDRVESLGEDRFRFVLAERSTAGIKFKGEYLARYAMNGRDRVEWTSDGGNVKSAGLWRLEGDGARTRLAIRSTSELEIPVPRILKAAVQIFADRESSAGFDAQIERFRAALR